MMKEKALPPLFPKTTVVVFVFVKRNEFDWTLEKGKNEMLENLILQFHGSLIYRRKFLKKHKGLPLIKSGEAEIRKVLSSI